MGRALCLCWKITDERFGCREYPSIAFCRERGVTLLRFESRAHSRCACTPTVSASLGRNRSAAAPTGAVGGAEDFSFHGCQTTRMIPLVTARIAGITQLDFPR